MKSDKQIKREFKLEASQNPDQFYATQVLKEEGFQRNQCESCSLYFWSTDGARKVCGDSACVGGFDVSTSKSESKSRTALEAKTYTQVWTSFKEHFNKRGYKAITRYPVVARWNPTVDFTIASIAAFQPFVVSGEVDAPAPKLTIPQFCLRFGDIDNVGVTGSHATGFVMIGQHQFVSEKDWDQNQAFKDIYTYVTQTIGLSKDELTLHEDAWAGGGNFGPCMEFFARGLELFNQVYMLYEQTPEGRKPLTQKVLDMGLGMERLAWFTQGTANMYEAIFPKALETLRKRVHLNYDVELFSRFSRYAGMLNVDEVEDINAAWDDVAGKLGLSSGQQLREKIMPMTAAYSILEHSRALLVALADGMLPSNVGGGYNLRVILRRALSFIEQFGWKLSLTEVAAWHAKELEELFPELSEHLEDVQKILAVEEEKFHASKQKAQQYLERLLAKENPQISDELLLSLYDSKGISPELLRETAKQKGLSISIPDNFYAKVAQKHQENSTAEKTVTEHTHLISLDLLHSFPETKVLYYDDWSIVEFSATVLHIEGKHVLLDQSRFYPTSGGQEYDTGSIAGQTIASLSRDGKYTIHTLAESPSFSVGDTVSCSIDFARRKQLAQHHSSAHIINAAARKVLGNHINQAGAHKKVDKAHLDITHFASLDAAQLREIEHEANRIIEQQVPVNSIFVARTEAEQKYSVRIYQGGVAPGKVLRIVEMPGVEVEACGGTHLRNTKEAEKIMISSSTKISDGIVRINYLAGKAAFDFAAQQKKVLSAASSLLSCSEQELPDYATALFTLWKKARKAAKKGTANQLSFSPETNAQSTEYTSHEILEKVSEIFRTQVEHIPKTIERFVADIKKAGVKLPF